MRTFQVLAEILAKAAWTRTLRAQVAHPSQARISRYSTQKPSLQFPTSPLQNFNFSALWPENPWSSSPLIQLLTGGISSHIAPDPLLFQSPTSPSPETTTLSIPCTHSPHTCVGMSEHFHFFAPDHPYQSAADTCCSAPPRPVVLCVYRLCCFPHSGSKWREKIEILMCLLCHELHT